MSRSSQSSATCQNWVSDQWKAAIFRGLSATAAESRPEQLD